MPSYVLVVGREPTQIEIDIAALFKIPIRKFDVEKYDQVEMGKIQHEIEEQYDYTRFKRMPPTFRFKQLQ